MANKVNPLLAQMVMVRERWEKANRKGTFPDVPEKTLEEESKFYLKCMASSLPRTRELARKILLMQEIHEDPKNFNRNDMSYKKDWEECAAMVTSDPFEAMIISLLGSFGVSEVEDYCLQAFGLVMPHFNHKQRRQGRKWWLTNVTPILHPEVQDD